jgi:amino acid adenylation domain-containing protein/non-ribosomal peptide synthase protein (TIGR01720 family)
VSPTSGLGISFIGSGVKLPGQAAVESEVVGSAGTIVEILRRRAEVRPSDSAFSYLPDGPAQARSLTYGELEARAHAIASHLVEEGFRGERVLLLYPVGLEFVEAFFGCLLAGVVAVPAPPPRGSRNLARLGAIAADAAARAALSPSSLLSRYLESSSSHPALNRLRWVATDLLAAGAPSRLADFSHPPESVAYLQYTSGSTSEPKGVMIQHANIMANSEEIRLGFRHSRESRSLSWLPHFHDMGLVDGILQPVYSGFPAVLMSPASFLQTPARWLEAIARHRITHSGGPNFAYDLCSRRIDPDPATLDLRTWAVAYNGAEPVRAETLERFAERFAPCGFRREAFYPAYGLAEATLKVSGGLPGNGPSVLHLSTMALEAGRAEEDPAGRRLVGSGPAGASTRAVVVEPETGLPLPENQVGEIWVSGPGVALGYWGRVEESERTFGARLPGERARFLRTGDLGFLRNGEIFVAGRRKDLIIIRGRNLYPQDVERTVEACDAALRPASGACFGVEVGGEERLVAVHEIDRGSAENGRQLIAAVRTAILETHEVDPLAIVLVGPAGVPKTSSGKVQRAACRKAFLEGSLPALAEWRAAEVGEEAGQETAPGAGPADPRGWLAARLASKLGVARASLDFDGSLARHGLDSLRSLELAHEIEQRFGAGLTVVDLLSADSLAQIVARIEAASPRSGAGAGVVEEESRECPLSAGQQALWFLHELAPESAAYTIAAALRLEGPLDEAALETAARALISRHPSLRGRIVSDDAGSRQRFDVQFESIFRTGNLDVPEPESLADQLGEEAYKPFDFANGPLFRMALLRAPDFPVLMVACHHGTADLWSLSLVLADLQALYAAALGLREAPPKSAPHPADFVRWQAGLMGGPAGVQQLEFWRERLAGDYPALDLPIDRPRPAAQTFAGGALTFPLPSNLTTALRGLARDRGVTLYTLLLAAYQVFLHRLTGQAEVRVGSPASGRTHPKFAELVACLVNTVVLRADFSGDPAFETFLGVAREEVLGAIQRQDYPFATLVKKLAPERDPSRSPLFDTLFDFHGAGDVVRGDLASAAGGARVELGGGLTAEPLTIRRRSAQFDLTTTVTDAGTELWVEFEYNSDLFEAATLDRFARHFTALLAGIASHPATRVSRLPLLAPAERAELLHDANARPVNAPFEPVHRRFEREALRHPGAAAAFHDGAGLTYGELNRRANALARRLRNLGVGPESRVAVCFAKSLELLVALMGVLKAGGAYVPIDPSLPAARRRFMASDSGAGVLLAPETLADDFDTEIEWVDLAKHANLGGEGLEDSDLQRDPSPENLAYLIYTSGTAGTPKAVGVTHANLSGAYGAWEIAYHLRSLRTHLQMASPGFDVFSGDLVRALCSGGSLLICDRDTLLDPPALAALARARRAEFAEFVPATLRELAGHLARTGERLDSLKVVAVGSDTWSMADYRLFRRAFGEGTRLVNSYGVTEATIDSTVDDVGEEHYGRPVPAIGRPLANTAVYVLDPQLEPVPAGVCGELCLGGPAVARGYVGRPDLTADRFRPDPHGEPGARLYLTGDAARRLADGRIEFIGRADSQVKIRGYRVELAEIEAVLKAHPLVRACAVVAHAHVTGSRLAGYVVLHEGGAEAVAALRAHLAERLPDYMVPPEVVVLDALPLSPNGKIDRRALPPPEWKPDTRHVDRTPATGTERDLAEIWKTVLGLDRVGPEDNFFQLGGDSILSLQIVARAREAGLRVTPRMLFEHPTLAGLAGAAERQVAGASVAAWTGEAPLLPMQEWFFAQEFAEPSHWNMAMALEAREPLDLDSARRAAAALLDHHDALRARFQRDGSSWRQRIVPPGQGEPDLPWVQAAADESLEEAVGRCARRLAGRLDITRTTAIGFGIAADESMTRTVLVLVAHHLVVDGVSWRLLVEDFERAYRQVRDGKPPDLPPRTAPAAVWATSLVETARAGRLAEDWDRWRRLEGIRPPALPWDRNDPAPLEASTAFVTVDFEEGETGELRRASAAHGGIENVLLAALACACSDWMGSRSFYVELEGHGRDLLPDLDVSRTVGWFTQTHPVLIEGVDAADFGATLEAVGSAMRAAPGGGFEAWRRVSSHPVARGLGKVPGPEISFNYLGRFQSTLEEGSLFRTLYEPSSPQRSPRARRTHGVEIDASIVGGRLSVRWSYSGSQFDAATLDRVAAGFRLALTEFVARAALPDGIEEMLPLTPMQEGMLFHHLREAGGDPYLSQISLTLTGDVDPVAMERAWRVAIDRHPALRAEFIWEGVESPIQRIRRQVTLPVALHEGSDDRLEAVMSEARARGFDVSQAPLARVDLVRTTPNRMVVVFTHHHLLLDGWSLPLVLGTVFDAYEALVSGGAVAPAGAPALRRYAAWLAASDLPAAERFFRETLAGFAMPTPLPDVGRPHLPAAGSGVVHLAGPADVGVRAGALGLTAGTVVQAAWALTLAACSGERDVLFGATSSGRPAGVEGIETLAGVFINTLPMRARIDPRSRARDWMRAFQLQGAEVRQREHAPLALVQRCAATAPNTPLFESVLVFENYPMDLAALGRRRGFEVTSVRLHEETNYPLTLVVEQGDRMRFRGIYRASRYDEAGVRLILERLSTAVEALLSHPGALLGDISVLPADERRCVLEAWNATRRDYPRDSSIVEVFEQVARERGGAVALASAGGQWTYGELRERALEVAAALRRRGVGAESRVALAMDRSPELIMAILGVLQAGGAYVPLDPESPLPRSARMLSDAGVSLIVTDGRVTAPRGAFETVLFDDLRLPREESLPPGPPPPGPDALAYVMFTSGSTGEPKGIEVTHRNVLRLVLGVEYARLGAGETLLQLAPVAFDASTFEIWGALLCGGSLAIAPSGVASASEIARLLERFSVTAVWLTSGLFHLVVDEEIAALARVSQVIAGGDVLNPAQVRRLLAAGCRRVVNGYGPTETTTFACCEVLSAGDEVGERVPIGRPVANSRAYVLDETMAPVPIGAPGELYVGGDGVSRGYAGRMDLTAARFVPDPFGGSGSRLYRTGDVVRWRAGGRLEFLGRRDGQVKVRGFRVEVGEVEKALARLPGVRAAAVAARSDGESTQLVGYLVPGDAGGEAGAWRDALEGLLPRYMIPSRFVVLDALPLKSNGKVDRHRLPAPDPIRDRSRPGRPLTAVEREVADLWRRILKVEAIGPDDDFFAAGGHSLHATRLLAALRRAFRVDLPMAAFYEEATVAGLARTLIAHQPEAGHVERAARALAKLRSMAGAPRRRPLEESRREVETL